MEPILVVTTSLLTTAAFACFALSKQRVSVQSVGTLQPITITEAPKDHTFPIVETKRYEAAFPVEKSNLEPVKILLLGGGLVQNTEFSPEFMEISHIFSQHTAEIVLVDHDKRVLQSIHKNNIYLVPLKKGSDWTDLHQSFLDEITTTAISQSENKLTLPLPNSRHNVRLLQSDFSKIAWEEGKHDLILAFNSLIYLFNNEAFNSPQDSIPKPYQYLKCIIRSLKVGGLFFVDKTTFLLHLQKFERFGISNVQLDKQYIVDHIVFFQRLE